MKLQILANPVSGRGRGIQRAREIERVCEEYGINYFTHESQSHDDVLDWAYKASRKGDPMVVIGGDGTLSTVLNGVHLPCPTITVSPLGTGNVLSKVVKIPKTSRELIDLLLKEESKNIDLANIALHDKKNNSFNHRSFLCLGFGFDGEIVRLMEEHRNGPIHMAEYIRPLAKALMEWKPKPQNVIVDGEEVGEFVYGVISGVPIYGHPLLQLGDCSLDDQSWDIFLFKDINLISGGLFALAAVSGNLKNHPNVTHRSAKQVIISGDDPTPIQIDGDFVGYTPCNLSFDSSQFQLTCPK